MREERACSGGKTVMTLYGFLIPFLEAEVGTVIVLNLNIQYLHSSTFVLWPQSRKVQKQLCQIDLILVSGDNVIDVKIFLDASVIQLFE